MEPKLTIKGKDRNFSRNKKNKEAIRQFEELVHKTPDAENKQQTTRNDIEEDYDDYPLVKINTRYTDVDGLTNNENRELEGVLNPENSIDPQSKIGDNGALQI